MKSQISIVIPFHYLEPWHKSWLADLFARNLPSCEFLIVANGMPTVQLRALLELIPTSIYNYRLIFLPSNRGWGGAIIEGARQATTQYVCWLPSNGKINGEALEMFLANSRQGPRVLVKALRRRKIGMFSIKSLIAGLLHSALTLRGLLDSGGTPSLAATEFVAALPSQHLGPEFDAYVLLSAQKLGMEVSRIKTRYEDRNQGDSSWRTGFQSEFALFVRILKICWSR